MVELMIKPINPENLPLAFETGPITIPPTNQFTILDDFSQLTKVDAMNDLCITL